MNSNIIPSLPAHQRLRLRQNVHVNHRESWLPPTVTSLAPRSVEVSFTSPAFAPLASAVSPWAVRPADGTTRNVAAPPWKGRDGWMVLHFTDGEPSVLPPGAVLRLATAPGDGPPVIPGSYRPIPVTSTVSRRKPC